MPKVVVTDYTFPDLSVEEAILKAAGATEVVGAQCKTWEEVAKFAQMPTRSSASSRHVNAQAIAAMKKAKVISRYGIGVDNVDLAAAKAKGIRSATFPTTASTRWPITRSRSSSPSRARLFPTRCRSANGLWKAGVPGTMMRCLRDMTVGVVAFGRIGREVVKRLVPFGCKILVFDPVASKEDIAKAWRDFRDAR